MNDFHQVQQRLDEISENLGNLEREVFQLESEYNSFCESKQKEFSQFLPRCKSLEEYLLQVSLQVDALQVSRESVAKAFREKQQGQAKEWTKLLTRRKKTNERVRQLLERLDTVVANLSID